MQQVQPAFIMAAMQSQHAWIMAPQSLSPLVQVIVQPLSVISHLHMPIIRLQQQAIIPFIIMQQLHMPPAIGSRGNDRARLQTARTLRVETRQHPFVQTRAVRDVGQG